jgi:hypothetical protein
MPPSRSSPRIEPFPIQLIARAPQLDELTVLASFRLSFRDFAPDLLERPTAQLGGDSVAPKLPRIMTYPIAGTKVEFILTESEVRDNSSAVSVEYLPGHGCCFQRGSRQAIHYRPISLNEEIFELALPLLSHLTQLEDGSYDANQSNDGKNVRHAFSLRSGPPFTE